MEVVVLQSSLYYDYICFITKIGWTIFHCDLVMLTRDKSPVITVQ